MKRWKRRRRGLGASARPTRERTGVPYLEMSTVTQPVVEIMQRFEPCGEGDRRPAAARAQTTVRDAATGTPIPVRIQVVPTRGMRSALQAQHELTVLPDGGRRDYVVLKPNADVCMPYYAWNLELRNVLTHELTHVADTGLFKAKKSGPRGGNCAYYSNPHEATAFLAQMRDELREFNTVRKIDEAHRAGFYTKPEDLLRASRLWPTLRRCLKPAQRKRYLRLAGQLWQEFRFDQPPLEGARARRKR
jgi:hypothetical protein